MTWIVACACSSMNSRTGGFPRRHTPAVQLNSTTENTSFPINDRDRGNITFVPPQFFHNDLKQISDLTMNFPSFTHGASSVIRELVNASFDCSFITYLVFIDHLFIHIWRIYSTLPSQNQGLTISYPFVAFLQPWHTILMQTNSTLL